MSDAIASVTIPTGPNSIVGITTRWVKNGLVLTVNHPTNTATNYTFTYLTDAGSTGSLQSGDVVSVTATTYDANFLSSTPVSSVPASVTMPTVPPPAPTSVTIATH